MDTCGLEGLPQDHRLQGHGTWRYHSPAVTLSEAMETTRIPGVVERTGDRTAVVTTRPYRAPHHTISDVGLIGGGQVPLPGDVSLAHHGVLFLDELPEFRRHVLEGLRQPFEDGLTDIPAPIRAEPDRHRHSRPAGACVSRGTPTT